MTGPYSASEAHLAQALSDESFWVRLGAARAIVTSMPQPGAQEILLAHWNHLVPNVESNRRSTHDTILIELIALAACLEWSAVDGSSMLVNALGRGLQPLLELLQGDWDDLVEFIRSRVREELPDLPIEARGLFIELRRARGWRLHPRNNTSGEEKEEPMTAYENAAFTIEHDSWDAAPKGMFSEVFAPIASKLRSPAQLERKAGIDALLRAALTEKHWYIRDCSQKALASLGLEASLTLLSALKGKPPLSLTGGEIEAISADAMYHESFSAESASHEETRRVGENLLSYLAGEALQQFSDDATAAALAALAASSRGAAAERALHVLLRMQVEVCGPALFWECVNGPLPETRDQAYAALSKVLDGLGRGEHRLRQIGLSNIDPTTSLDWLTSVAKRCQALPEWASDPLSAGSLSWSKHEPIAKGLLQSALLLAPRVAGESRVSISYYSSPMWDKFCSYIKGTKRQDPSDRHSQRQIWRRPIVELPKRCLLGSPVKLVVGLEPATAEDDAALDKFVVQVQAGEDHANLLVLVKSTGFTVRPDYAAVRVPATGPSERVDFTLVATCPGLQTVEITFFRGTERVGYCTIDTNVVENNLVNRGRAILDPRGSRSVKIWDGTSNEDLRRRGATRAVIFADSMPDGSLEFSLLDPAINGDPRHMGKSPLQFSAAQVTAWILQQGALVRDFLKEEYPTEADLQGAIMGLRALGNQLYEQLVPPALTPSLEQFADGVTIAIESNAHWVPWEILSTRASGPVLGERFQLIRIPRKPASSHDATGDPVPLESTVDPGLDISRVLSVTGDDILSAPDTQTDFTLRTFGVAAGLVRDLVEGSLIDLHAAVVDADILHFTCHGRAPPYHLSIGPGQGRRFFVKQVRTLDLKAGAVVFVNACSSAQSSVILAEMENFGFEFYARGARPFVGTLGPVPKDDARQFAQLFYSSFIGHGMTAGDALFKAKRDAANVLKRPSWMFYCLYGPASARRVAPTFAGRLRPN
jgi:hypothetical protein